MLPGAFVKAPGAAVAAVLAAVPVLTTDRERVGLVKQALRSLAPSRKGAEIITLRAIEASAVAVLSPSVAKVVATFSKYAGESPQFI